jgi:hypothetical protein
MTPGENNSPGDTFFRAVRYISKDREGDWSVGVMAQRETGREPFASYKDTLPKDHKLGENSFLSTSVTGQRTSPRGLWIC